MSDPVSSVNSSTPVAPATAAEAAKSGSSGQVNASTNISSLAELKEKAPKVYQQMMISVATTIVNDMKARQDHIKQIWAEARRNSESN